MKKTLILALIKTIARKDISTKGIMLRIADLLDNKDYGFLKTDKDSANNRDNL